MRQTRTFGRFTTTFSAASLDPPSSEVLRATPFGDPIPLPSNTPFRLDDPATMWVVASGEVDLFYVSGSSDPYRTVRRYIGTIWSGEVVTGIRSEVDPDSTLIAVGFGGASLHAIPFRAVNEQAPSTARIARALIIGASETIGRAMHRASRSPAQPIEAGPAPHTLTRGTVITAPGETVWFAVLGGELRVGGTILVVAGSGYMPLPRGVWLTIASESADVEVTDTLMALGAEQPSAILTRAWQVFLAWIARSGELDDIAERGRLGRKIEGERLQHSRALAGLSSLLRADVATAARDLHGDTLVDACAAVGAAAGITLRAPPGWNAAARDLRPGEEGRDRVAMICSASHVRYRRVALRERWWTLDAGPMLGFLTPGQKPVALLSDAHGGYSMLDPAAAITVPVTESLAATIDPFAYTFYRPAPFGSLKIRALGQLVIHDIWPDLRRVLSLAGIGAILGLALPAVTGKMFNDVIPSGAMGNALTLFAALVAVGVAAAAFDLARALALIRVEGRSNAVLQSAIVDRLLALPAQFFRQYSVGDLSARADAVNGARQLLTGVAITSILGGALTLTSLGLMIWINARLAMVAGIVLVIGALVTAGVGLWTLRFERQRETLEGSLGALVFELLSGIAKLNVAAAEPRMFALWGVRFRELKQVSFRAGLGAAALGVFNDVLPIFASAALFMVAVKAFAITGPGVLATGDFIAFYAAFGGALAAGTAVSNTLVSVLNVVPLLERAAPILATSPEVDDAKPDAGAISGRIELAHVTFGYVADSPPIVDDVSFEIRPGEFVAFVGPSGAGKSTILRLLLGFERPDRGAVYFDGHDLASIDVGAIRRQCAVVLQQSRLLAGDIFTNIVGASPLTLDDAWRASELAGLADDIRAMPMGMHTVVSEGGSTLSGGQRQRLLIARALVRKPRVVFFDEATSALDNRSQEIVTRSLEEMRASRIVIAHRLTTVQRADRIFVMAGGRIVQQGHFEELLEVEGLFQQLAARQLV